LHRETLIQDLDDALPDPKLGFVSGMNYALISFDYGPKAENEITQFIGPPLEKAIQNLTDSKDEKHINELIVNYRERYFDIGYTENELCPNIVEILSTLLKHNIRMGVCASKLQTIAVKFLERFEIEKYFEFVDGSTEKT